MVLESDKGETRLLTHDLGSRGVQQEELDTMCMPFALASILH